MVVDDQLFFSLIFPFKSPFIGLFFHIFPWSFHDFRIFPIFSYFRFRAGLDSVLWLARIHGFVEEHLGPSESWEQTMVSQATHMGVSISGGFIMEKPIKMDWSWGYPHFRKPGYEDLHDIFWGKQVGLSQNGGPPVVTMGFFKTKSWSSIDDWMIWGVALFY